MRKPDIYSASFLLAFAFFAAISGIRYGVGSLHQPGSGFFPFCGALVLSISGTVTLVQALRQKGEEEAPAGKGAERRWQSVLYLLIAAAVYGVILETVGFVLCTFFLFLYFLRVVAPTRWSRALLISVCVAVASHLVFNVGLDAELPKGFLGF